MREEIERRATNTSAVLDFFRQHPLEWISVHQLASPDLGGFAAWRTRISDARKIVKREGGDIVWNHEVRNSCYRYHPQAPLGRDAGEKVLRGWDISGPFTRIDIDPDGNWHERHGKGQQSLRFK